MDKNPFFGQILSNLDTAIFEVSTAIDSKFDILINKIDRLETKLRNSRQKVTNMRVSALQTDSEKQANIVKIFEDCVKLVLKNSQKRRQNQNKKVVNNSDLNPDQNKHESHLKTLKAKKIQPQFDKNQTVQQRKSDKEILGKDTATQILIESPEIRSDDYFGNQVQEFFNFSGPNKLLESDKIQIFKQFVNNPTIQYALSNIFAEDGSLTP